MAMPDPKISAPPAVDIKGSEAPVKVISSIALKALGEKLSGLFTSYAADRRIAEIRWLRNQRQYLGVYDPEIEKELGKRSRAYPRLTRVKCISVLARLMNLMFPGNEKNWALTASPSPDLKPEEVQAAVQKAVDKDRAAGVQTGGNGPQIDEEYVQRAIETYADAQAGKLTTLIDDQLQELGGDQTVDYIALNRKTVQSGILYGLGVLRGPFVRECKATVWSVTPEGKAVAKTKTRYKPQFEFLPIWDFYPDMSAKNFAQMDGYFVRMVMSKSQLRKLADRVDYFGSQIKNFLKTTPTGNYKAREYETELKMMGVKANVNDQKPETNKYEVICWHGPVNGHMLRDVGVDVKDDALSDEIDAEVWTVGGQVIKAVMNPWVQLETDVKTIHTFLFDEDDTSPVGVGLPNAIRDSQMSIAAATRMLMDNASVVCGPQLELNTALLRPDQDLSSTSAYKIWYRDDDGPTAAMPAVRNVTIDAHLPELLKIIELFMQFADQESFVGPATGGDMSKGPSEPFRTAAGASMLKGDAALPFKDVVRNFDLFTQSVINSLVQFNRKFNPDDAPEGDYNVVARGASSLIAKEIRGMQVDQLAATLRPEEMMHVDERKLVEARFKVRDLEGLMVSAEEAERRKAQAGQQQADQAQQAKELAEANVRKLLSDAFKNIAQGNKNSAAADAQTVKTALDVLEKGLTSDASEGSEGAADGGAGAPAPAAAGAGFAAPIAVPAAAGGGMPGPLGLQ